MKSPRAGKEVHLMPFRITIGARSATSLAVLAVLSACRADESADALRFAAVGVRDVVVTASAAGVIEPIAVVEVKSQASGEIVEVLVDEGEQVTRGQLLVRVDPRIPRNAVIQAEADSVVAGATLENAQAHLDRAIELHGKRVITDEDLESARLSRASAYAALIRAQRTLEDANIALVQTEVRAPASGMVLGRSVEVGSVIASASRDVGGGAVLLRMATLGVVEVRALVDETDIGLIHKGMTVTIAVAAFPGRSFAGEVARVGAEAVVSQNVTMFPVLVRIRNDGLLLKPGMNAEVTVTIGEELGKLAVPNSALRSSNDLAVAGELLGLSPEMIASDLGAPARSQGRGGDESGDAAPGGGRGGAAAQAGSGRGGGRGARGGSSQSGESDSDGGRSYVVFAVRDGMIRAVNVRTGLTDFDYSIVLSGLAPGDSVVILPTAGLLAEQAQRQEWINRRVGSPLGRN